MAFNPGKPPAPIEISRYLGINEAIGETEIQLGESISQLNWRITQNYKPQKRLGHKTWWNFGNIKNVQGAWSGVLGATSVYIAVNDGKVYKRDLSVVTTAVTTADLITATAVTQIGTMTDAKTTIFYFESKLYFLNGTEYKQYDGTTFADVDPYIPTVAIALPPAGGLLPELSTAQIYEPINLLTGKKKAEFLADGVATAYQLAETGLDAALVTCTMNGVTKVETTDFTVVRSTGIVTFAVAPADEAEVIIGWTKTEAGNADLVKKNKYAMINGPGNDTAIFLWGNPAKKNRRSWSGTLKANYFPVTNFTLIGSNEFAITDIKPQYNRQIIFKEDKTHYSYAEWNVTAGLWDYPVYDLNEKVGNIAYGAVQIVRNNPVSISGKSWWEWTSTSVEDERNADVVSERLRDSLTAIDISTAITFDNQAQKEYWCCVGSKVYIWNYGNNTMYIYDNISGTCFLDIAGSIYYGSQGTVERMEGLDDNGVAITAQLILGFKDWDHMELMKNSKVVVVSFVPYSQTSLNVYYKTNRLNEFKAVNKTIEYRLLDFNELNFDAFSFSTNRNPQPFRRKIRAKKYAYIQFMLENKELNESCVVNSLKIQAETQGETK